MALRTCGWSFLCLILLVTFLAILMERIFCGWSLSLCRCLMACCTSLRDLAWFLTLQFVVTFLARNLLCFCMFLMVEFYLTISIVHGVIIFCLLSESATHHKQRNDETCQNPYADQVLFHYCFTPFLLMFKSPPLRFFRREKFNKYSFFVKRNLGEKFAGKV